MAGRTVGIVAAYAVAGPAIGLAITLAVLAPAIRNLGPVEPGSFFELAVSCYVIGLPPMVATGLLVAAAVQRGAGAVPLLAQSGVFGFLLGGLSAMVWGFLGSLSVAPDWRLILAIAIVAGLASLAVGVFLGLFRVFRTSPGPR